MKYLISTIVIGVIAGVIQGYAVIEERIFHGTASNRGDYPWASYLNITTDGGQNKQCTGTLISDEYVITAADCVDKAENITVFLGMQRSDDENGTMMYVVDKNGIILYPTYRPSRRSDNIALLKLPSKIDLYKYEYVDYIRLPVRSTSAQYEEKPATVAGWGTYNNTNESSIELRFAQMEVMTKKECKRFLRLRDYPVSDGTICAEKSERKGPCVGDSGGPLNITLPNGDPILIGINSYPIGRCSSSAPAIFSYMGYAPYLDWINKTAGIDSLGHVKGLPLPTTVAPQ